MDRLVTSAGRRSVLAGGVVAALSIVASGCSPSTSTDGRDVDEQVVVFAAASLASSFRDIAVAYEAATPTVDVQLSFGGSASLREQILDGAPAGVFASADAANMGIVVDAGRATGPAVFARNRMEIAVPAGNPAKVSGLADVAADDLLVGLCAASVPCGRFAREVLANAGVTASPDTEEGDVGALITRIAADELDVGITYATDVASRDDVDGIAISDEVNVTTELLIVTLDDTPGGAATAATDFVDFVLGPDAQAILADHGFGAP